MKPSVILFPSYKTYLNERLDSAGRGSRARLSQTLGCQTAYTAQVLRGSANFSLEQAEIINGFFEHDEAEALYFILLVQLERCGSPNLKRRLEKQLRHLQTQHLNLKNRLKATRPLSEHNKNIYYSSWIYGAVHALVSIPGYENGDAVADRLSISVKRAEKVIGFLVSCGLLLRRGPSLQIGKARLHLDSDSELIAKHHLNWRLRIIQSVEAGPSLTDLHYSSVVSLSKADAATLREQLIQTIQRSKDVIKESREEDLRVFCLDFFGL